MDEILRADEVLIKHQYKMCLHGRPTYLVPFELVTLPDRYCYVYDEDAYKPLWPGMETMMPSDRLKELLSAIAGLIDDMRDYLLEPSQVQFDEWSVLQDEHDRICFKYWPFEAKEPPEIRLCMMMWLNMINKHVDPNCERSMTMLHPLGIAAAADGFDLMTFGDMIRTTIGEGV